MTTTRTKSQPATPRLDALLASGVAMYDGFGGIIALAADGQWVQIGALLDLAATELYLASHPEPKDW